MTNLKTLANAAGLYSILELSDFLQVRMATARQFWYGETEIPQGVILELYEEYLAKKEDEGKIAKMGIEEVVEFVKQGARK